MWRDANWKLENLANSTLNYMKNINPLILYDQNIAKTLNDFYLNIFKILNLKTTKIW